MRDSLRVCRDPVMLLAGQEDKLGIQTGENPNAEINTLLGSSVLDDHKRLSSWVYRRPVKRMARNDFNITGQILVKGSQLRGFTRGLSADYGTDFGRGAILCNDLVNELGLDAVNDPVAGSRNKVTIG